MADYDDDPLLIPLGAEAQSYIGPELMRLRAELDARMHRALDVARAETREAHARRRLVERERDTARARVAELEVENERLQLIEARARNYLFPGVPSSARGTAQIILGYDTLDPVPAAETTSREA